MKKQTIGDRLKLLRNEYRLTQADVANAVGLSLLTISNIERNVASNPYPDSIESIATVFGTTYEWLSDGKGDMLPNGKIELNVSKQVNDFNPATDTLYKELKDQIMFYRNLLTQMAGGKGSFLKALNQPRLQKAS